jgi:hypothetical protein
MRRLLAVLLMLIVSAHVLAQRPPAPPADQRADLGRAGWSVDAASGCWVWVPGFLAGYPVTWPGPCPGGPAQGEGTLAMRGPQGIDRFTGTFRDGRAEGFGRWAYANGDRQEGQWRGGIATGPGRLLTADGTMYQGTFQNDLPHGLGLLSSPDGTYEGAFADGQRNGRGVFVAANGDRYDGPWRNGRPHGRMEVLIGGRLRVLEWREGCARDGEARLEWGRQDSEPPCP